MALLLIGSMHKALAEFVKPEVTMQTSRVHPLGSLSLQCMNSICPHDSMCSKPFHNYVLRLSLTSLFSLSLLLFWCQRPVGGTVGVVSFKHIVLDEALHLLPTCRLKPSSIGFKRWQVVFSRVCEKLHLVKISLHFEVKLFECWWTKLNRFYSVVDETLIHHLEWHHMSRKCL